MKKEIQHALEKKNYKEVVRCLKSVLHPRIMGDLVFFKNHYRFINYKAPCLLDEKLLILRGRDYYKNELICKCADKYAVRDYISSCGRGEYLNELLGVYDFPDEIQWELLPEKFVIKCNHGSGYNIIVKNKSEINTQKVCQKLSYWLEENYGVISSELQYKSIQPKILVEKFLEGREGELPVDYKFFASRGKVICCLLVTGRETHQERIFVDDQFNNLNLVDEYTGKDYQLLRPTSYDEMIEVSKRLSVDFPFVRVDLYDVGGKVVFGELTFTPHGCNHEYLSDEAQKWICNGIKM